MWNQTVLLLSKPSLKDEKYTRLYTDFQERNSELLHVIAFLDWNPPHLFLKCVEFCSAVSVKNSVKLMIIAASLGLLSAGAILQESPSLCLLSLLASPSLQRDPWAECPRKTCFKFVMRSCLAFSWLGRLMSYYWKGTAHTAILGVTYPLSPCQLLATVIAEQQTIPLGALPQQASKVMFWGRLDWLVPPYSSRHQGKQDSLCQGGTLSKSETITDSLLSSQPDSNY